MRVKNSIRNILFGLISQIISTLLAFFTRTIFIYILGKQYLGIEGLMSNVLSLLSITNLGFESAIIFSLYKPIKEKKEYEIRAYMKLYKNIYRIVGVLTFVIGILIIPFLNKFIGSDIGIKENIYLIYIMFLLNGSISYFYVYKQALLIANQENYIISKIHTYFLVISNILQILILITFKAYIPVLAIQLISKFVENVIISKIVDKRHKFLKLNNKNIKLSKEKRKSLYKSVYSMLLYKISGVIINSTDNLVISYYVGLIYVGLYSNYLMIVDIVKTFISYLFFPITASVGDLLASNEESKKIFIYNQIFFSSFWIYGFCSITLYMLLNDFIKLWIGNSYLLNNITVFIIVVNFYTAGMQCASTMYRDTTGLFNVGKYRPLVATLINLLISIILAPKFKIVGVLLGTIISRFCVYFWLDPYIVHKYIFKKSCLCYFKNYILKTGLIIFIGFVTYICCNFIKINNNYISFVYKIIICILIPNILLILLFRKNEHYLYIKSIIKFSK